MFRIANGALGVFKRRLCLLASRFQTEPPANQIGEYPALHLPLDLRRTYAPSDSPKEFTFAGSGGVRLVACLPRHPPKRGALVQRRTFILLFLFLLYMDWWSQPGVISAASEQIVTLIKSCICFRKRLSQVGDPAFSDAGDAQGPCPHVRRYIFFYSSLVHTSGPLK